MLDEERLAGQGAGGGRPSLSRDGVDQNFDSYAVEYTFADGAKMFMDGRYIAGCTASTPATSTAARVSRSPPRAATAGRLPAFTRARTRTAPARPGNPKTAGDQGNPYANEWNDLVDAIRNDKPYNEAERGVQASLVSSLGRKAAHTGKEITLEEMLNSDHDTRRTRTSGRWIRRRR